MTVTEMFAKHLIQIPGFSADKAEAVITQFPTPTRSVEQISVERISCDSVCNIKVRNNHANGSKLLQ